MVYEVTNDSFEWQLMPGSEVEEVLQNVRCILSTLKYQTPLDREFGIEGALLDTPISVTRARLTASIARAVREQEGRARIESVNYAGSFADGQLKMKVRVEIVEKNLRGGVP